MKNNVIIKMGASKHEVIVKGADGKPVVFNLYRMTREQKKEFHREFMKAWRAQ